jgi:hypothetical protein
MYSEENSKLISGLYNARNRQEISDILEYMGESGDCIFVYPILDGYRKYKQTSIGYYFIWILSRLDYPELGRRLNELLESYEIQKEHIPMALFLMAERRFFSDTGNNMAKMYLESITDLEFRKDFEVNCLGLSCILDYLYEEDVLVNYEKNLREIIFDKTIFGGSRVAALCFLLECNQEKQIDFLIDNYFDKIQNTFLEKHLVRRLLFCQTHNVRKLRSIIMENGQKESAEFFYKYDYLPDKKSDKAEFQIYNNINVVIRIGIIREQINRKTISSELFGFDLFPRSDLLIHQGQCMDDKNIFLDLCKGLLQISRSVNPRVRKNGLSKKEVLKILEDVPKRKWDWDITHLYIYLVAKKICIDNDYFGFRQLNEMLELIIEDKKDSGFYKKLESFGIADMYRKEQWHKIHSVLTNNYLQNIETMNHALGQYIRQDLDE